MAGVVKFRNPLYNPEAVQDVFRQIASLRVQGSLIIEHHNGSVSNVSFSASSESEVMNIARGFMDSNPDIVCIRIPVLMSLFISRILFYPLNIEFMVSNFELSAKLRLYFSIASEYRFMTLGARFPVSIRKRYLFSQSLVIYPNHDCVWFAEREIKRFMSLANVLGLESMVGCENGVPVIEITEYFQNC